jgi:glycosyltransferase involved in cell wall biosynthesis
VRDNGFDAKRIVSVPTGIDTTRFVPGDRAEARARLGLPSAAAIVGIVATLRSWKGHVYLLDAFAGLGRDDARLVIVGDGPQREAIANRIAELGLGDRVTMPGNQNDVLPWLQSFDVFALPSYANEGVPQAILQAMLCGLPVVTTDVGSIGEAIVDGDTGLVVPPKQAAPLAEALVRLLDDAGLRSRLGTRARAVATERFGLESMLDHMERVFLEASASRV